MLDLLIPFFKNISIPFSAIPLGIGFILFTYLVINGASNAVNLTDGLDGLAIMPIVLVAAGLGVFAYLAGDLRFANYLHLPYVKYSSELVVICAAMIGAGLAFLWYNAHPAQVFMGDVGAVILGCNARNHCRDGAPRDCICHYGRCLCGPGDFSLFTNRFTAYAQ